jgi:hypothetical protein
MILSVDSYVLNAEQNHFNKVYRANTRTTKIRNSNIEIRNKSKNLNPNYEILNGLVLELSDFGPFEIVLNFGFRASNFFSWRPLRLCASHLFPIRF